MMPGSLPSLRFPCAGVLLWTDLSRTSRVTLKCFYVIIFICLLLAVLGLHCCTGFSLVAASRGYSLVAVRGLLIAAASLVVEHGLWSVWAK